MWTYRMAAVREGRRTEGEAAIRLLSEQVERARRLLAGGTIRLADAEAWDAGVAAALVAVYGRNSPNTFSVAAHPAPDAAWVANRGKIFGGRREIAQGYLAGAIEERARLLEQCIVSLRFALDRSTRISPATGRDAGDAHAR
jgi:hypothetical protein